MNRKIYILIFAVILLSVPFIMGVNMLIDRRMPNFKDKVEIYVFPDTPSDSIYSFLVSKDVVKNKRSLKRALSFFEKNDSKPKVGHYTIIPGNTSMYVRRMLEYGWQTPVNLILPSTMRLQPAIAKLIDRQMLMDSSAVISALRDSALLSKYGFTPENVFALFVPDNYQVYWTDSISVIFDKQKKAYDNFWTEENKEKARGLGLTQMEVSVLASIVRGESNYVPEYPKIASVYLNRLKIGMKLQADPTVAYCFDYTLNRIYRKHTQVESPFNTYKYYGLPPAPICVPTRDCLNAVLNPDKGDYLYFCASPELNGRHLFASNYIEHLKNARAFQKALDARIASKNNEK